MIRFAQPHDFFQIRTLWEECFPDSSGFNEYFFRNKFELSLTLVYEVEGEIAAMLQMLPYSMQTAGGRTQTYTYIYGACTHPNHRRKQLMRQLLEQSFAFDCSMGRAGSILIPAEPWLFSFYEKFGYQAIFSLHHTETENFVKPQQSYIHLSNADIPRLDGVYRFNLSAWDVYLQRTPAVWMEQIQLFETLGLGCLGLKNDQGNLKAYAFVWKPEGDTIFIQELGAKTEQWKQELLAAVAQQTGVQRVRYCDFERSDTRFGCMKPYNKTHFSSAYMNLMFN